MADVLAKPDTEPLLRALGNYAPDVELRFESLAGVFVRDLPWWARMWCAVLLGRTAKDPARSVEVLALGLSDPEAHVRAAVVAALGRAGGRLALPNLRWVASDQAERGMVRNAAVKALGKLGAGCRR